MCDFYIFNCEKSFFISELIKFQKKTKKNLHESRKKPTLNTNKMYHVNEYFSKSYFNDLNINI
jgi:hypothetical protein